MTGLFFSAPLCFTIIELEILGNFWAVRNGGLVFGMRRARCQKISNTQLLWLALMKYWRWYFDDKKPPLLFNDSAMIQHNSIPRTVGNAWLTEIASFKKKLCTLIHDSLYMFATCDQHNYPSVFCCLDLIVQYYCSLRVQNMQFYIAVHTDWPYLYHNHYCSFLHQFPWQATVIWARTTPVRLEIGSNEAKFCPIYSLPRHETGCTSSRKQKSTNIVRTTITAELRHCRIANREISFANAF